MSAASPPDVTKPLPSQSARPVMVCPVAAVAEHGAGASLMHVHMQGVRRAPIRYGLAALGLFCFGLAAVGVFVPGMPTTVFLLIGSFCLTRSCPWLEEKLLDSRLFRPYAEFVRSREPMSAKARIIAMSMMWLSIAISMLILALAGKLGVILAIAIPSLGIVGTVAILMFRRKR
jgi:uncharacterized protein